MEMESARECELAKLPILTVRTSRGSQNQITSMYAIDDKYLEMVFILPVNFPLRSVLVEGVRKVGVSEEYWRRCLISSTVLLNAHNQIIGAIKAWKLNLDAHFEGVEECGICYAIIGVLDSALPNKTCRTCHHGFHSGCLVRVAVGRKLTFRSSNGLNRAINPPVPIVAIYFSLWGGCLFSEYLSA